MAHILQKHEYLGHMINFKLCRHFKDKKSHYVDKDQWLIFEDTHEPIINREPFDNVQRIRGQVRRCSDCHRIRLRRCDQLQQEEP